MTLPLLAVVLLGTLPSNLIVNPGFEGGLSEWASNTPNVSVTASAPDGGGAARIHVADEAEVGFAMIHQAIQAKAGDILRADVRAMGAGVRDGYGVYAALEFYDAEERRISFSQSPPANPGGVWRDLSIRSVAPPTTVTARLCLLLNGRGTAHFDDARLLCSGSTIVKPLDGPVTLTLTDRVVCDSFLGFGFEDDGWTYNQENAKHGLTEEDYALRESRIEWMRPDLVRMFFWHRDWCPDDDWATYSFDSDNMRSHYRTLDLYQRLGTHVNVTGVEWGIRNPYADPERVAVAIGDLLEHLVRVKGYRCIRYWTLTNEPDTTFLRGGGTFEDFVRIHQLVKAEFRRRKLDIQVVGSDDALGIPWFRRCLENEDYFQTVDLFSSHRYFPYADREIAGEFVDERLLALRKRSPVKPLIVGEFGFHDHRSGTLVNPIMETYPYAVWAADFAIQGLNRGVSGFSIWCLHEVYYPGNGFMNYALWDFKDNEWKPRPVYHAWANLCRLTQRGDRVRECVSSHPSHVRGAVVGETLFWVNRSDEEADVHIDGGTWSEVRAFTESTLQGDRECGTVVRLRDKRFRAPAQSFGYAR